MHFPTLAGPRRRTRRAVLAAFVPVALGAAALPAGASAATLSGADGTLFYQGGSERNSLSIREVAGALIVSDPTGLSNRFLNFTTRGPCIGIDRTTMRCPGVERVEARMAGGDDTVGPFNTHLPVVVRGESGNDTYVAGNPSFLTNVNFVGGGDVDTASYAGSGQGPGGRGVRIANDGFANDGRIGLDTDNIGRDVENLTGSPFADEITGTGDAALRCCVQALTGGQGDDVLRAGGGTVTTLFEMGPVADGADRIIGGSGSSSVRYDSRTRPVNVTLNFAGADDGEAGERDEIIGSNEQVVGGRAGDTLRAPASSTASHNILGLGGGDNIEGSEGADTLSGGAGGDTINSFGGNDRVFARDGELDSVDCGLQTDTADVDSFDNFGRSCENGTIGVLRLAPSALRVRAGETAELRLSWRHPRAWRKLRKIELRLDRDGAPVGEVTIRPRGGRIGADGAVKLLRKRSRLSREGKTVIARLAVRLDERLAGQTLKVDVEATDARGARQLEPDAGTVRIAR